jgi:hypothetical protein
VESDAWQTCNDPETLLEQVAARKLLTERKARLLAVAACRRNWAELPESARGAVRVAEAAADGLADEEELRCARRAVAAEARGVRPAGGPDLVLGGVQVSVMSSAALAGFFAACPQAGRAARDTLACTRSLEFQERTGALVRPLIKSPESMKRWGAAVAGAVESERAAQADQFRCFFARPPDHRVIIEQAVLDWHHATVIKLAQRAYDERDFGPATLSVLADALEEAGCTDAWAQQHLRGKGPHARGCAVVDAVLGKS